MEWAIASSTDGLVGQPHGGIDELVCDAFLVSMKLAVKDAAQKGCNFVLDLAGIDHISACGLMAMTLARRDAMAHGIQMLLARPNEKIREVLQISRYDSIFQVIDSVDFHS